jgi:hypothetical protein
MYTKNGIGLFTLYFPPIDTTSQKLDFIEDNCNACYKIKGVDLSGKSIAQLYEDDNFLPIKPANKSDMTSKISSTQESSNNTQVGSSSQSSATYNGSSYNIMFAWKKKGKVTKPHWNGMGIALANFDGKNDINADLSISTSYSFIINTIDYKISLSRHWLLVSGMGLDFTRYHFKNNVGLTVVNGNAQFVEAQDETYKSSKLITYYITIPLLLEYQTRLANRHLFYISGGIIGYIKYYSKSQIDVNVLNGVEARNLGRDLNILPANGRLTLQAGINDIGFYAYYSPFSIFEKDKGPDIKPIGIGIMFNF